MKKNAILILTAMVILALLTMIGQVFGQMAASTPTPTPASEILTNILANQDGVPLTMYPVDYIDEIITLRLNPTKTTLIL